MPKLIHSPLVCGALSLFVSMWPAHAQETNILADTANFKATVLFSDVYGETIVQDAAEADPERISVFILANLAGATVGNIDATTPVHLVVGNFEHEATLGDAPNYVAGARTASFPFLGEIEQEDGTIQLKNVGSLTYSWNSASAILTIKLTCTNIEAADLSDIAASDYYGEADTDTEVPIINEPVNVAVTFGQATGVRTARVRGITKTVSKGGDDLVTVILHSVKLSLRALALKHRNEQRLLLVHQRVESRELRAKQLQERRTFTGSRRALLAKQRLELRELIRHHRQENLELRARQSLERREHGY